MLCDKKLCALKSKVSGWNFLISRYNLWNYSKDDLITSSAFPKQQLLDSSKLKEFADDNFKFHENGTKFPKWVENTVGKGEIEIPNRKSLQMTISNFTKMAQSSPNR